MKKACVVGGVVAALWLGTSPAGAQSAGGGVKGGVNFSTVTDVADAGSTSSLRKGVVAGGFLHTRADKTIGFQIEGLYSQEGVKISFTQGSATVDGTGKVDFIRVPVLLRVGSVQRGAYAIVGPSFGAIISAKQEVTGQATQDFKDDLRSLETSLLVGVGFEGRVLLFEARYQHGFQDINKVAASLPNKARSFTVLVGVHFK